MKRIHLGLAYPLTGDIPARGALDQRDHQKRQPGPGRPVFDVDSNPNVDQPFEGAAIFLARNGPPRRIGFTLHPDDIFHAAADGVDGVDEAPINAVRAVVQPITGAPFRLGCQPGPVNRIIQQTDRYLQAGRQPVAQRQCAVARPAGFDPLFVAENPEHG
jgi:hypothetical protein